MSDTGPPYIGRSLLRREDRRLLMGQGQFVADLVLPRMLHAVLVRSPVAHAKIRAIDLSRAAAAPGVMAALNGADLLQMLPPVPEGQISLPKKWTTVVQHKFLNPRQPLLAHDKVRHVGEAVAIIVAESRYQAEDAAELVTLDLEELPAVVDPEAALSAGAPIVHDLVVDPDRALAAPRSCIDPRPRRGARARHRARCRRRVRRQGSCLPRGSLGPVPRAAARPAGALDRGAARAFHVRDAFARPAARCRDRL